jgi:hypothetical protein
MLGKLKNLLLKTLSTSNQHESFNEPSFSIDALSLSDNISYPDCCARASIDSNYFNNFRRNPAYTAILEHVTQEQGLQYLEKIQQNDVLYRQLDLFRVNDKYGHPNIFSYQNAGDFSPSTLRYIKVLNDLETLFGSVDHFNISEVGIGYGGQCLVINAYRKPANYLLVDIQPALALAKTYLDKHILSSALSFKIMNELAITKSDLFISNYAFTELKRSLQEVYFERLIAGASRGYITYNDVNPPEYQSMKKEELLERIPNSFIIEEYPLTHPNNCIIVWGAK